MRWITNLVAALIVAVGLSACETFSLSDMTPSQQHTARIATKLGVQIGVLEYVGQDAERAQRVRAGLVTVKALLNDTETVDIYEVQAAVNGLIDKYVAPDRSPQQVLLLKNAVTLIVTDIELLVPEGTLTPETRERVLFYVNAVIEAVNLVIGPEPVAEVDNGFGPVVGIAPLGVDRVADWPAGSTERGGYIPTREMAFGGDWG